MDDATKIPTIPADDSNRFYADDLSAEEIAENKLNPESLKLDEDIPISSDTLSIGDLDKEESEPVDDDISYDEENMAGGDNVVDEDALDEVVDEGEVMDE